jgi:hypothetical protein
MAESRVLFERYATARSPQEPHASGGGAVEWEQKQEPAEYYRAAAARARALVQEATTPRVKRHLRELIDRYDRLAGEVERTAEKEPGANLSRSV